jgi:predicted O-methyltransferase YrrM
MFKQISQPMRNRMEVLEEIDQRDRQDGTPHLQRMRQIPPETGKFLALTLASAPAGKVIEVGTSAGYSALWLSLACRQLGRKLITFEVLPEKVHLARETFRLSGVEDVIELVEGDALQLLGGYDEIAFCFLDAEKDIYLQVYELVVPKLVKGGLLVADNAISHGEKLQPLIAQAQADPRTDAIIIPVGKGELVCRKL